MIKTQNLHAIVDTSIAGSFAKDLDSSSRRLVRVKSLCRGSKATENVVIHGDNLVAMQLLANRYAGEVRCAYIDPPYNNGESYTHYRDNVGHKIWLADIAARMRLIRDLLSSEGSLWISIDDREAHYLKVAADEVFGRANFVSTIVWEHRKSRENRKAFSANHEYILVYAKNSRLFSKFRNGLPASAEITARYKNPDCDPRGAWQSVSANVQSGHATPTQFYAIIAPNGQVHLPPNGRCWVYNEDKMKREIVLGNIWFGSRGTGVPRLKRFLTQSKSQMTPETLWRADDVGTTEHAKKHLLSLFPAAPVFDTPKPESLLARIVSIASNPGDLVLDAYLGSGTTAAVCLKSGRKFIGIEVGAHASSLVVDRLQKVVDGELGGVSGKYQWRGGGGFEFCSVK